MKMLDKIIYLIYRGDYAFRFLYRRIFKKRLLRKSISGKRIMTASETENYIKNHVSSNNSFMAGRLGTIELSAVEHVYQKRLGISSKVPEKTIKMLCSNAGFFPNDECEVEKFTDLMLDAIKTVDLMATWQDNELYLMKFYTKKKVAFCQLKDIEPVLGKPDSWVKSLAGKKVLVIHPYAKSIQMQYEKRKLIFPNGFLPEFELKTLKAVQTIAGTKDERFNTWFDALYWMEEQIDNIDFDIALIGCGAYGFPLAAYIKNIGKQAIHLGGATQLIFGIMGSRWEEKDYVKKYVNEYWARPLPEETPDEAKKIENGCYW